MIRGSGELGGYRWGLERKQALLGREGARAAPQRMNRRAWALSLAAVLALAAFLRLWRLAELPPGPLRR